MTEKISGSGQVPQIAFEGGNEVSRQETVSSSSDKVIENLDNSHSAVVGRSMVQRSKTPKFDGKRVESIRNDLKELNANYKLNEKAVLLADAAMSRGMSYEDAIKVGQEFINMHK